MPQNTLQGVLLLASAGLFPGSGAWPTKLMKKFQLEHSWFISMLSGPVPLPRGVTPLFRPGGLAAYALMPLGTVGTAKLQAADWGIARVLCSRADRRDDALRFPRRLTFGCADSSVHPVPDASSLCVVI
jgi:hypothetical protein